MYAYAITVVTGELVHPQPHALLKSPVLTVSRKRKWWEDKNKLLRQCCIPNMAVSPLIT